MALSIRNPEVERLARRLAAANGTKLTEEILDALRQRELAAEIQARPLAERLRDISRRCAALPDQDQRPVDEILGYDLHGGFDGR
jgi:antitoxin VapB